jgi:hypothetical protein
MQATENSGKERNERTAGKRKPCRSKMREILQAR